MPKAKSVAIPAAALLAAAIAVLLAGCGAAAGSGRHAPTRSTPLESIFQADEQMQTDPEAVLALLRRLGVDRVRVFVAWGQIDSRPALAPAPFSRLRPSGFVASDPAAYPATGWAVYDRMDRAAALAGVRLDFTLSAPAPEWATQRGEPPGPPGIWKPSATEFGAFVRAVATRYSGHYPDPLRPGRTLPRVSFWGIWNEPNLGIYLAPQGTDSGRLEVSPAFYRQLLDAAWSALQATGHGSDTILIGELAPRGRTVGPVPGNFDMMVPLRFLRALYCVDASYHQLRATAAAERGCPATASGSAQFVPDHPALFHASGVADHPYPQGQPPNVTTALEPDYADFAAIPKLERTLDQLQHVYGSATRFPIYSTEFGYETDPPEHLIRAIAPPKAAYYMNWAEYLSWRDPRIRSYDQYLLTDPPSGNFSSGLEFADGTPKPSFFAYRMPLFLPVSTASRGKPLEVWGCARPARYARATGQHVEIQFEPIGSHVFRTLRTVALTDPDGYFDVLQRFPGSGAVRIRWVYPRGPAIFSRIAPVVIG